VGFGFSVLAAGPVRGECRGYAIAVPGRGAGGWVLRGSWFDGRVEPASRVLLLPSHGAAAIQRGWGGRDEHQGVISSCLCAQRTAPPGATPRFEVRASATSTPWSGHVPTCHHLGGIQRAWK